MNCRPGDLARIVGAVKPANRDRFVEVLRASWNAGWWICTSPSVLVAQQRPTIPGELVLIHDACLRPIRGQDGTDETLVWLGKPETADA